MSVFKTIKQLTKHVFASKHYTTPSNYKPEMGTVYDIKVKDVDGNDFNLGQYKGSILLICNVASECGYTKCGYEFLVQEQNKYADRKFQVLAFPCNQFGAQEPGGPKDIKDFAADFGAKFPILEKGDVNGDHTHSLYKFLKDVFPGDVTWNFQSWFIIDENGVPIARFTKDPYPDIDVGIKHALDARDQHEHSEKPSGNAEAAATIDTAVDNPRAL
jgi:glutathione peroxidase